MKIKVCGMKQAKNIADIADLHPDFMGFIFYEKSPRFVDMSVLDGAIPLLPPAISKVGVFVNEDPDKVVNICMRYGLTYAQLHGDESPAYCAHIKAAGILVIKVFSIAAHFDFLEVTPFKDGAALFLFDTKTKGYGGSGVHFDWQVLNQYALDTPFLLSGGISSQDVLKIKDLNLDMLLGIDVNSQMEISPGFKAVDKVNELIFKARDYDV